MAIIECTNPHAGSDEGYSPNNYQGAELEKLHAEKSHETSYEGCVLRIGEHNWYDDSDFYAMVWDRETQSVKKVTYATTRGWTYHNGAKVDATAEVRELAESWEANRLFGLFYDEMKAEKLEALKELTEGVEVRSLTTRGKNKGVVGTVVRVMKSSYGPGDVAGVLVDGEEKPRWIDTERVERTDFPADEDALKKALELSGDDFDRITRKATHRAVSNLS